MIWTSTRGDTTNKEMVISMTNTANESTDVDAGGGELWQYHGDKPPGPALLLLSWDEFRNPKVRELIERYVENIGPLHFDSKDSSYSHLVRHSNNYRYDRLLDFHRALRKLPRTKKHYIPERDEDGFHLLNRTLNEIFSDNGWVNMRKRIRQIIKRANVKRPPLSDAAYARLAAFRDANGLETFDAAVMELLDFWEKNNVVESDDSHDKECL